MSYSLLANRVVPLRPKKEVEPDAPEKIPVEKDEVEAIVRAIREEDRIEDVREKEEERQHELAESKAIADKFSELATAMEASNARMQSEINDLKAMVAENVDVSKILLTAVEDRIAGMLAQFRPSDEKAMLSAIQSLEATVTKLVSAPKLEFDLTPIRGTDGRILNVKAVQK